MYDLSYTCSHFLGINKNNRSTNRHGYYPEVCGKWIVQAKHALRIFAAFWWGTLIKQVVLAFLMLIMFSKLLALERISLQEYPHICNGFYQEKLSVPLETCWGNLDGILGEHQVTSNRHLVLGVNGTNCVTTSLHPVLATAVYLFGAHKT